MVEEEADGNQMATGSSSSDAVSLFTPYRMGKFHLSHRVVLAPMVRMKCYNNIPQEHMRIYYLQRASIGGLLISEGTGVSETAQQFEHSAGIWTKEQVNAWKPIVEAVHRKGSIFFCQLWHAGRTSFYDMQPNRQPPISCTNKKINPLVFGKVWPYPRRLRTDEIPEIVNHFVLAARNAMEAGFDGVEIHAADGLMIEQFMKDGVNNRNDDEYGGCMENRCRFALEIVKSVSAEIGSDRVGVKLSTFEQVNDCVDSKPEFLALYMAKELNDLNIGYLHVTQSRRITGCHASAISLLPMRNVFKNTFIVTGDFNKRKGNKAIVENYADLIAFGRLFLENPDLPRRFKLGARLNKSDPGTWYTNNPLHGYIDYPFLDK